MSGMTVVWLRGIDQEPDSCNQWGPWWEHSQLLTDEIVLTLGGPYSAWLCSSSRWLIATGCTTWQQTYLQRCAVSLKWRQTGEYGSQCSADKHQWKMAVNIKISWRFTVAATVAEECILWRPSKDSTGIHSRVRHLHSHSLTLLKIEEVSGAVITVCDSGASKTCRNSLNESKLCTRVPEGALRLQQNETLRSMCWKIFWEKTEKAN